ncbi:hypothetical protein COOONC_26572 [Cooperia oncophora]
MSSFTFSEALFLFLQGDAACSSTPAFTGIAANYSCSTVYICAREAGRRGEEEERPHHSEARRGKRTKLANFGRYVAECLPKFVQQVQVGSSLFKFCLEPTEFTYAF